MEDPSNVNNDGTSFWKKYNTIIPGRPSPKNQFLPGTNRSKSVAHTSFQDFAASVSDAWELDEDEFCPVAGDKSTQILKRISQSAALNVLNNHRTLSTEQRGMNFKHQADLIKVSKIPGRCQLVASNVSFNEDCESKLERFQCLLSSVNLSVSELCQLSWSGVPIKVHPITWRLLSGYLPVNQDRRESMLQRKRQDYWSLVKQYYDSDEREEAFEDTYHQIHIDVPRMNPTIPLFQQHTVQKMFERILFIWAIRHPASGYVQGINDLVTPFYVVFLQEVIGSEQPFELCVIDQLPQEAQNIIEADSFWCLSKFLDGIQDNYVFAQLGIQRKVNQLKELIQRVDNILHRHLITHNVDYLQFSFRWLNNLLTRELPLRCTIRLWDTYLAENDSFAAFQLYVCAAFLLHWRDQLLLQKDFQSLMLLLQNLPTQHWNNSHIGLLVAEAYRLKVMFADAPNHLQSNQTNS